jgi:hypothetical protein
VLVRPVGVLVSLFAALLLVLNDTDGFTMSDVVDFLSHGVFHHEIFVIVFLVLAAVFSFATSSRARNRKTRQTHGYGR